MPGRNGTGPMGMGRMMERGFGSYGRRSCNGNDFGRRGFGNGPKFGLGYGYGSRCGFRSDITEKEFLQKQKEFLESQIELIERELDVINE